MWSVVIHYESQCVPTPFAWYFHNMPVWFKRLSTSLTFYIEIYQPLAFLLPISCLKKFVFLQQALLMVLIILSGNYNFFNILIIVICIPMLERGRHVEWFSSRTDMFLSLIIGIVLTAHYMYWFDVKLDIFGLQVTTEIAFNRQQLDAIVTKTTYFVVCLGIFMFVVTVTYAIYNYWTTDPASRSRKLFYCLLAVGVATPLFTISIVPFVVIDREVHDSIPETLRNFYYRIDPYQIVNPYGLFRTMTGLNGRPEVIVEGAADPNGPWKEFSFYSKPGNVSQAPIFVLPHQPRLDWQLWFAALGSYRYNPFFLSLTYHLMEDTPEVLRLMSRPQPFKETPRYIRAQLYHYHYTTPGEKVDWWTRELQYEYMPTFPKRDEVLVDYLKRSGLLLTKEYDTTNILDLLLLRLHSFVYAIDQAIFVWGMVTSCLIIIAHKFLSSFIPFGLFSLPNV
uniref:Lipase maturation factor n=1 Tax=Haemonchus contortus TaxID=6289 RepID=A0A7I4Z2Z1_HAECO